MRQFYYRFVPMRLRPRVASAARHFPLPEYRLFQVRTQVAGMFLKGEGIELGALNQPLQVPPSLRVRYVDRLDTASLRAAYPEIPPEAIVPVDFVADGEHLDGVPEESFDFVIANHFIEHTEDPIGSLKAMLRVLRKDGAIYLSVPDKRFCFDADRPSTTIEHLVADHRDGGKAARLGHFEEWVKLVLKCDHPEATPYEVNRLDTENASIHFHCWTAEEFQDFLRAVQPEVGFLVEVMVRNEEETIFILRRADTGDMERRMVVFHPVWGWQVREALPGLEAQAVQQQAAAASGEPVPSA